MSAANIAAASQSYQAQQEKYQQLVQTRQQLETQFQENKIVKDEFDTLPDETKIFKLTGPVLLPQDEDEAKSNVDKRLEYIQREIKEVEERLKKQEKELTDTRNLLVKERTAAMMPPAAN